MNEISSYDTPLPTFTMQGFQAGAKPDQLREACEDAEGLFAGILLKEGLKPMLDEAAESESHAGGLMEYSIEEMAREIGREGMLGIADQFYSQLSGGVGASTAKAEGKGVL